MATAKSFFSRFKHRIRDVGGGDPGGRYFSILLEQLFHEEKTSHTLVSCLFPEKVTFKPHKVSTEHQFHNGELRERRSGRAPGSRWSDLVFFKENPRSDTAIGLVEVKEEDQKSDFSDKQTRFYLNYIKQEKKRGRKIHLAYVTKHEPSEKSHSFLMANRLKPILYNDLYEALRELRKKSPIAELFCKYLEEEGGVYTELKEKDGVNLQLLLRGGLPFDGDKGFKRGMTIERQHEAAKLLAELLENVSVIGNEFHEKFRKYFGNRFLPHFHFSPEWSGDELAGILDREQKSWSNDKQFKKAIVDPCCTRGSLYVYSQGRLKTKKHCFVWLGYQFSLKQGDDGIISSALFAGIGRGLREFHDQKKFTFKRNRSRTRSAALLTAKDIIVSQIQRALEEDPKMPGMKKLRALGKSIGSR